MPPTKTWGLRPIAGFFARFLVIYTLLILPWPGWDLIYARYLQGLAQMVFEHDQKRVVLFQSYTVQHGFSLLNSRVTVSNRDLLDAAGNGPARNIELDLRSIGWVPTALTAALILATPVPWARRGWALLWGLVLVHAFILFSVQSALWAVSPDLSLITFSPFWGRVVDELDYALITQMGASFSVPVLIWILVTFRRQDYANLGRMVQDGKM